LSIFSGKKDRYDELYGNGWIDSSFQSDSDSSSDTTSSDSSDVSTSSSSLSEDTESIASEDALFDATFLEDFWEKLPCRRGRRRYYSSSDERDDEGVVEESGADSRSDRSYYSDQRLDMEERMTDNEIQVSMSSETSSEELNEDCQ